MIDDFANSWHLTNWDWLAFFIAILSFIVASVSLLVAVKTLRSQKQTEENTTPIMKPDIQRFLVEELFEQLIEGYMGLNALGDSLAKVRFDAYPPSEVLMDYALRVEDLHCELYYDKPDDYRLLQTFRVLMENYNRRLVAIGQNLANPYISDQYLKHELIDLLTRNMTMAKRWRKLVRDMYGYTDKDIYAITARVVNLRKKDEIPPDTPLCFDKDDFYVKLFSDASDQDLFCAFMSDYTQKEVLGYDECLIPLQRER